MEDCFLNREVCAQNTLLDASCSISILCVSLCVWAQMPCIPGKRRSAAQNAACRAPMAAINSQKKDKENLNPSNSDDLDTVSHSLYSTTVNKLIAMKKKLHNVFAIKPLQTASSNNWVFLMYKVCRVAFTFDSITWCHSHCDTYSATISCATGFLLVCLDYELSILCKYVNRF